MLEDLFDHRWIFDGGDDGDPCLAGGTSLEVDTENSLQKASPMHAFFDGAILLDGIRINRFKRHLRDGLGFRNDLPAVLVMGRQHS